MTGEPIKEAGKTLKEALNLLPPDTLFNIIGFGSHYTSLFKASVPNNKKNLEIAQEHAKQMIADLGGTELLAPLTYIFSYTLRFLGWY